MALALAIGNWLMVAAGVVLLASMAALAVWTWRRGSDLEEPVQPTMRPLGPHRSHLKVMAHRGAFVPMKAIVEGRATPGEYAVVAGFHAAIVSLWLIFLGAGIRFCAQGNWIAGILLPLVPGIWLGSILSMEWRDFRRLRRSRTDAKTR